jgi:hypothetical protein
VPQRLDRATLLGKAIEHVQLIPACLLFHCFSAQVPTYHNDFPDWDVDEWSYFVPPSIPHFLVIAVGVIAAVLLAAVVCAFKRRPSSPASQGYTPVGETRDRSSSWW